MLNAFRSLREINVCFKGHLILRFGYWMPLEWDEIKRKLDTKDEGQILISSPGEPTNTMNYYFSIEKISK